MKYVSDEQYRTFRGYVFWQGKPVDVTDKATLAAIQREPGFRRYEDPAQVPQPPAAPRSVLTLGRRAK